MPPRELRFRAYARRSSDPRELVPEVREALLTGWRPAEHFHPQALRVRRVARDMSLEELSRELWRRYRARVHPQTIATWESGLSAPTEAQSVALGEILGCDAGAMAREPVLS